MNNLKFQKLALLSVIVMAAGCTTGTNGTANNDDQPAETVLVTGKFYTVNEADDWAEAVANLFMLAQWRGLMSL